ncbi:putative Polyadenylate-binding protein [Blattamonas nauphoetae]|uniref:Polyadenylate-binding protein n=1 Tax=Blattamonas nauphoetae TaxID=2049346 RepID=A0ABQ9XAD0_9EUKA|nr:putative Polyadenylate-binding protein [Blattamonas nauphoetae]
MASQGTRQNTLFISDLADDVTEHDLIHFFQTKLNRELFSSVRVCRDHTPPNVSLKYGYLNFKNGTDAEEVLKTLNYSEIKGKAIRLVWSQPDVKAREKSEGNLYVKGIPADFKTKQVHEHFGQVGEVSSAFVPDRLTLDGKKYGYVQYKNPEDAEKALTQLNGSKLGDSEITVEHFRSADQTEHKTAYVTGFDETIKEETLKQPFAQYGEITRVSIHQARNNPTAYHGFVWYDNEESVKEAVQNLNDKPVFSETHLRVSIARTKKERLRFKKMLREQTRFRNLYVRGFPLEYSDDQMRSLFQKYGTITSCRVMRSENGTSRGFGFCCFSADEEARRAYLELNGQKIPNTESELYVNYSQSKQERKAVMMKQQAQQQYQMMYAPGMMPMMPPGRFPFNTSTSPGMRPMNNYSPPISNMYHPNMYMQQQITPPNFGASGPYGSLNYMSYTSPGQRPMRQMPMMPQMGRYPMAPPQMPPYGRGYPYQFPFTQTSPGMLPGMPQMGPGGMMHSPVHAPSSPHSQTTRGSSERSTPGASHLQPVQIDSQQLARMSQEEQRQTLGEALFPQIENIDKEYAGKITGMLLELDTQELVRLLEDPAELLGKVNEARQVLIEAKRSGQIIDQ